MAAGKPRSVQVLSQARQGDIGESVANIVGKSRIAIMLQLFNRGAHDASWRFSIDYAVQAAPSNPAAAMATTGRMVHPNPDPCKGKLCSFGKAGQGRFSRQALPVALT